MNQQKIAKLKAERAKKHRLLTDQRHREGVEVNKSLKESVERLYKALNDKEPFDVDRLSDQIQSLGEVIDIKAQVSEIHEAIKQIKPEFHAEKIDLTPIIKAIEENKPDIPPVDLSKFEKAIIEIQQRVQEQPAPDSQLAIDYKPFRRVVRVGNRLIFDDQPTPSRGGGGGSSSSSGGLTDAELRASPVDVEDTVYTTRIDEASDTVTYIGDAAIGTATSAASWRIKKIDSSSGTSITFAGGNGEFTKVWNDRASLSYS